jgi:hypothetical protein
MSKEKFERKDNAAAWIYIGLALLFCGPMVVCTFGRVILLIVPLALMLLTPLLVLLFFLMMANILTNRPNRKQKPYAWTTLQNEDFNPDGNYMLDADGELIELRSDDEKPKHNTSSSG